MRAASVSAVGARKRAIINPPLGLGIFQTRSHFTTLEGRKPGLNEIVSLGLSKKEEARDLPRASRERESANW
jgi:hypothetical protein